MKIKPCIFHGSIGCGKSSWVQKLSLLEYKTISEDLSDIIYLHDYWTRGEFAFHTQIGFYSSWLKLYNKAMRMNGAFIDSSIFSHHYIFTKYMYDTGILSTKEYKQCEQLFQQIIQFVECICIYIRCSPQENINRVQQRNRVAEKNSKDFILEINHRFERYYASHKDTMRTIDVTSLNPNRKSDVEEFIKQLAKAGIDLDCYLRRIR